MIAYGLLNIIDQLNDVQRQRDELLSTCQAAHRSLALARTAGQLSNAIDARHNAEELLYDVITKHRQQSTSPKL
jgi:hypothetical protein